MLFKVPTLNFKKLPEKRNLRLIHSLALPFPFVCSFLFLCNKTKTQTHTEREREREREMGVVVGVILDESVLLASNSLQHENPSLQPVVDSLLRKLRHSKIPTVFLSLFFNFIVLCPIYYYNRSVFSLIWGVQTFFYGQLPNLYVFITVNCVLGMFYFVNKMVLIILMN